MRWSDYQNHVRRRRRPYNNKAENTDNIDNSTKENDEYEIIEDIEAYKAKYHDESSKAEEETDTNYQENVNKLHNQYNKHGHKNVGNNGYQQHPYQKYNQNQQNQQNQYKEEETIDNSKDADLVSTIEKLFKGDNQMVREIVDTLNETGILENFREPLGIINRVYGPLLDGNSNNQYGRPPMWAYNKANRRIKQMQKEDANKQFHSEMYSLILKQVKDMLVKNYGTRIKSNMPVLFDNEDDE